MLDPLQPSFPIKKAVAVVNEPQKFNTDDGVQGQVF